MRVFGPLLLTLMVVLTSIGMYNCTIFQFYIRKKKILISNFSFKGVWYLITYQMSYIRFSGCLSTKTKFMVKLWEMVNIWGKYTTVHSSFSKNKKKIIRSVKQEWTFFSFFKNLRVGRRVFSCRLPFPKVSVKNI